MAEKDKKKLIYERRNGRIVAIDPVTKKEVKLGDRPKAAIRNALIKFSNKPFGFDYENLRGSKVYDESKRRFLTIGELRKRTEQKEASDIEKEAFEYGPDGQPSASQQLAMQKPIDKEAAFIEGETQEWDGPQPLAREQMRISKGDPSAAELGRDETAEFEWGPEGQPDASTQIALANNYSSLSDDVSAQPTSAGTNKTSTRSQLNIGPATGRAAMRARNVERFGEKRVSFLEQKQKDFKSMDRKAFAVKYPNSQTAKRLKLRLKK